jgi:hypothetical protein
MEKKHGITLWLVALLLFLWSILSKQAGLVLVRLSGGFLTAGYLFLAAVQWHGERRWSPKLFASFLVAAFVLCVWGPVVAAAHVAQQRTLEQAAGKAIP